MQKIVEAKRIRYAQFGDMDVDEDRFVVIELLQVKYQNASGIHYAVHMKKSDHDDFFAATNYRTADYYYHLCKSHYTFRVAA